MGFSGHPVQDVVQSMSAFTNTSLPLSTSTSLLLHTNIRATYLLHSHLLKYDCNFAGEGGHSLLWLEATTFLNYIDIYLIDHLLKYGWKFAGGGGNSLLQPEATAFLNHLGIYSRLEVDTVACGWRPQDLMTLKSRLRPGHLVTLEMVSDAHGNLTGIVVDSD